MSRPESAHPGKKVHRQEVPDGDSDLVWRGMYAFADRFNASDRGSALEVRPIRRWSIRTLSVEEGLWVGDRWTDVFEPIRVRRMLRRQWRELQSVSQAAAKIRHFVDTRPDEQARNVDLG